MVTGISSRVLTVLTLAAAFAASTPVLAPAQGPAAVSSQRVFKLRHREPGDVLNQVKMLVGPRAEVIVVPERNELVVRGPQDTLKLADQVLSKLDQPAMANAAVLQSYPVPAERQAQVKAWSSAFRGGEGERAAWDGRTGQLILFAGPAVHQQVKQMLAGAGGASDPGVVLRSLTAEQLHDRIQSLVNQPLPATWDQSRAWLSFPVRLGERGGLELRVEQSSGRVLFAGAPRQVASWKRIVEALDTRDSANRTTKLLASETTRSPSVRRALAAIEESSRPVGQLVAAQVEAPNEAQQGGQSAVQLPPTQGGGRAPQARTPQEQAALQAVAEAQMSGALLGPVKVDLIEGTDIVIISGNTQDVQRVVEIINRIEEFSKVTVPAIEIYPLAHVDGQSMARLLNRVYQQVLNVRTGGVSVTTLGKPNQLLLIGREENVRMAIDLIKRLDQPADPTSQFVVFRLKNAAAAEAKDVLDQFLENDEQSNQNNAQDNQEAPLLNPKAIVVADFRTNSLVVRAAPRDMREIHALLERIDTADSASVDEVRVFTLRSSRADEVADVLTQAITQEGQQQGQGDQQGRSAGLRLITIDAQTQRRLDSGILTNVRISPDIRANTIVVTAPSTSMELIGALIRQLDQAPEAEAELKVFTIKNGDAEALVDMLRGLFGTAEEDDPTSGGLSAATNTLVRLQFSVDPRTNSIIAAGDREDLAIVEAILLRLDGADTRQRRVEVYRLKNAPAAEVADSINLLLEGKRDSEQAADLVRSPYGQLDSDAVIVAEEVSNSLIINATDKYLTEIRQWIEELDERPPMVMIQVLIAEVKLNDTDEFGVELGLQDSLLFDRSLVGELNTVQNSTQTTTGGGATTITETTTNVLNSPVTPGFNFNDVQNPLGNNLTSAAAAGAANVATQGLSNFAVGRVNSELGFGGFVFSASSNSISMLLRALQENRRLEVLSRPQVMALDNQEGEVTVGARVPTIQGVTFNEFGQQTNQVTYENVGITLQVRPRISPDNQVVMEVYAEKSELGPDTEGIPIFAAAGGTVVRAPVINQTVARTTVAAGSGQTVVLSGLLTKSTADVHRRVPLLSDIPLLGDLFRYDGVSQERTELLIIMTPRIIRNEVDADMIKQIESARMSWVMCDVVNMHGPSGLRNRCSDWGGCDAEAVYPTYVPTQPQTPTQAPTDPPVQPEVWESARKSGQRDQNITPAGFTPAGGPGVRTPVRREGSALRLPPVE